MKKTYQERFMEHFPFDADMTLQILKGHLLIEEHIREIVKLQLPHSSALNGNDGASYDCHQMICLAEAITPESDKTPWVWKALKKLNKLRNYLAHKLGDSAVLSHKIDDLIKYVRKNDLTYQHFEKKWSEDKLDSRVALCIMSVNIKLESLKKSITVCES
ncbi:MULTISPECIES: hypothetical protein [unclassified Vibrio]|uniref:hypothetical protein n=1 Tax=unclassified Vibrio TaxID=2614977 RepID=UPI00352C285A